MICFSNAPNIYQPLPKWNHPLPLSFLKNHWAPTPQLLLQSIIHKFYSLYSLTKFLIRGCFFPRFLFMPAFFELCSEVDSFRRISAFLLRWYPWCSCQYFDLCILIISQFTIAISYSFKVRWSFLIVHLWLFLIKFKST
jgi:hypothetical protein